MSLKMANKILYGKNANKQCACCENAVLAGDEIHMYCIRHGLMEKHNSCRRFIYDPIKRIPKMHPTLNNYTEFDFSID